MSKYRKKPVVIEARQYLDAQDVQELADWCGGKVVVEDGWETIININTLEGVMTVKEGDYIIQGVKGEFYPCKPDIFEETYEAVNS